MRKRGKTINTMLMMLITMLATGVAVGAIFPIFAKMFVVVKDGRSTLFLISCLLAGLMLGVANYFIARTVLYNPIRRITERVKQISEGDLSVKIGVSGQDIIGQLANSVGVLTQNFAQLVADTQSAAQEVEMISQNVRQATSASGKASRNALDISNEQASNNHRQLNSVEEVNQVMANMGRGLGRAEEMVNTAAVAAVQFVGTASQGHHLIEQLNSGMSHMQEEVIQAEKVVLQLEHNSHEINGIVQLIQDISGQTNLLALNASIEAARAGQAGKGFMVVAEEVKKLSDASATAAKQIESLIKTMQKDVNEAVKSTQESVATIEAEGKSMMEARAVFTQIEATAQELKNCMNLAENELHSALRGAENVLAAMNILDGLSKSSAEWSSQVGTVVELQVGEIQNLEEQADALHQAVNLMTGHLESIKT